MIESLHEQLKRSTHDAHRKLDHHPLLNGLFKKELSLEHYGRCLIAFQGIHSTLEPMILKFSAAHKIPFDYQPRRKLPLLEADLKAMQVSTEYTPFVFAVPGSQSQLIGLLYTLEGSTLGGQVIARSIRQSLGETCPLQYFNGYGAQTRQRWQEFWSFAEAACDDHESAAKASNLLFAAIWEYFNVFET